MQLGENFLESGATFILSPVKFPAPQVNSNYVRIERPMYTACRASIRITPESHPALFAVQGYAY